MFYKKKLTDTLYKIIIYMLFFLHHIGEKYADCDYINYKHYLNINDSFNYF